MTFSGAFVPTFSGVFDRGAATRPWWNPGGTFTAVAAYQAKGAASLSASYTNLVTPGTYDAAPGTAPTWATGTGWTFTRTPLTWLNTSVVPVNNQSWSFCIRYASATFVAGAGQIFLGANEAAPTPEPRVYVASSPNLMASFGNGGEIDSTVSLSTAGGVLITAGNAGYVNGTTASVTIPTGTGTATRPLYINGRNNGGTAQDGLDVTIIAVAIYSTTLSDTQVATLTTQMNAL